MRLVIDTNILISALLTKASLPAHLITLWREGRFTVLMSGEQIDELTRVTRHPKIRSRIIPSLAGRLINELAQIGVIQIGVMVANLLIITVCADPGGNYLLTMADAGGVTSW